MSAQRMEEEDGAVGCSEPIRNLTALRGWEFFFNMANWPPDYRRPLSMDVPVLNELQSSVSSQWAVQPGLSLQTP